MIPAPAFLSRISGFCATVAALLCVLPGIVAASANPVGAVGPAQIEIVAATESATTLRCVFPVRRAPAGGWDQADPQAVDWGVPVEGVLGVGDVREVLPFTATATLAVPSRVRPVARVAGWRWLKEPATPVSGADVVSVSEPAMFRGVPLVTVSISPAVGGAGVLGEIVVEIIHLPDAEHALRLDRNPAAAARPQASAFAVAGVLNRALCDRLAGPEAFAAKSEAASSHPFAATDNWMRIEVVETGVHELTGYDMALDGLDLGSIDPASLRLYRAANTPLSADPEAAGSWSDIWVGWSEVARQLIDTDGVWDSADALRFYGVGPDCWAERREDGADAAIWVEHPYSDRNVYWLTWRAPGDGSAGSPLRVDSDPAAPHGVEATVEHRARAHFEESLAEAFGRVADNWAWDITVLGTRSYPFAVDHPVAGTDAEVRVEVRSTVTHAHESTLPQTLGGWINGASDAGQTGQRSWILADETASDGPFLLEFTTGGLIDGENDLYLQRTSPSSSPYILLDSFDVEYRRDLLRDGGQLEVVHWGDEVSAPGEAVDLRIGTVQAGALVCWDVTDPRRPRVLTGSSAGGELTVGVLRDPETDLHLVVFQAADLLRPAAAELYAPEDLRGLDAAGVDYVVLYAAPLRDSALQLAALRSAVLPGVASPRSLAVDVADIYDSFGGGVPDPYALRNFLKWLYIHSDDGAGGHLRFVCLYGDASRDYRGRLNLQTDLVPTAVRTKFPGLLNTYSNEPYATDDALVSFDSAPYAGGLDTPDVSIGRLTVRTAAEAAQRFDRIMDYVLLPEEGPWRNRVALCADDLQTPKPKYGETFHIVQAEFLSDNRIPDTIDQHKIYLTEYPRDGSVKPGARRELTDVLDQGCSIFYYVGHGSDNVLADEQLFLTDDLYAMTNGDRACVFMAFSCDVGIYDSSVRQSMGELFVGQAQGGAIAAITASQVSWSYPNNTFSSAFFGALFPDRLATDDISLGEALLAAKQTGGDTLYRENCQRYMLLSDPALKLPVPASTLALAESSCDSLRGGLKENVVSAVGDAGVAPGPAVAYDLDVQESRRYILHTGVQGDTVSYWMPGATTFHGRGAVSGDTLRIPFKMPVQLRYGPGGRVRLIVDAPDGSHAVSRRLPVVRAQIETGDDLVGPRIDLAFADGRSRVKPGTEFVASISDTSGVSILGSNPSNSILVEFDESGFTTDVSDLFEFDAGSYSAGRLAFPLPGDLEMGPHTAALYASDVLGNVGSDTLSFRMVAATVAAIEDITVFPNPTVDGARLLFELSDPMDVQWSLYTVSGRLVRRIEESFATAGPQIIHWDGRDRAGDRPGNGVYLYVLKGRGAADEHEITETGQLVIMR